MIKHKLIWIAAVLAILLPTIAGAQPDPNKAQRQAHITATYLAHPPAIDGAFRDSDWDCTKLLGLVSQRNGNHLEQRPAEYWVGYDNHNLYLAIRTAVHPQRGAIAEHQPMPGDADVPDLVMDDSIELWFAPAMLPGPGGVLSTPNLYQILINSNGAISDMMHDIAHDAYRTGWRVKMKQAHSIENGIWTAELAIDLSSFTNCDIHQLWGFRVVRNFKYPWDQARTGINVQAFDDPTTMPQLTFGATAPVVQQTAIWNANRTAVDLGISVKNSASRSESYRVSLESNPVSQPRYGSVENVTLEPGGKRELHYTVGATDPTKYEAVSHLQVSSQDGSRNYFEREFMWEMQPSQPIWEPAPSKSAETVSVLISHLPSQKKLTIRGSYAQLQGHEKVSKIALLVQNANGKTVLRSTVVKPVANTAFEASIELPDGMNGEYVILSTLQDADGHTLAVVKTPFERDRFEWENNKIGITDRVVPPFTPLKVNAALKSVSSVLKEHNLTDTGLWKQVAADGQNILAAPMRYVLTAKGHELQIKQGTFAFDTIKPGTVSATGSFTAGQVTAKFKIEFECDGMMKTTLDLKQHGAEPLDSFELQIPLKPSVATLMHEVTDDIRINYGGEIDAGQGVVWESKNASRNRLLGTFVPYIWFGNEYRGICWFAENDKGWILDDKRSALTLERTHDAVTLRVKFINKPGSFACDTRIVYGLLATPVRPMPKNPEWENFCANTGDYGYKCRIMGASPYWDGDFYANFPRNRDFTVVRKIAEASKTGKSDNTFFENLVKTWSDKTHDMDFATNKAHIMAGGNAGHYDAVMPYTNLRGDVTFIPEWRTFQDEWSISYMNKRVTDKDRQVGSTDFAITPVKSRQDFLLYYYKQFLQNGFDGIYWDNIFLEPCYNPMLGPAYTRSDGTVQPFVDIFRSRELTKRMMTLAWEMGKPNLNMAHMTNANLIPIFSFVGSMLGWEWRYGVTDFQDRFTPGYIRAVNLPFNNGSIPVQLPGIRGSSDPAINAWCERTQTGCTLVHQLNVWEQGDLQQRIRKTLAGFGVGTDKVRTFRYWDEKPVLKASEDTLKWIAYSRGGKAYILVCDYGNGGNREIKLDLTRLGLKPGVTAKNWETGEAMNLTGASLSFSLKKHDFRVIAVE